MTPQPDALPRCPHSPTTRISLPLWFECGGSVLIEAQHANGSDLCACRVVGYDEQSALAAWTALCAPHALAASRAEVERLRAVLSQIVEHREREDLAWEARCKWMAGLARAAQGGGT